MNSLRDFTFYVKICELCQLISQRVFNQKEIHCDPLKSSWVTETCN